MRRHDEFEEIRSEDIPPPGQGQMRTGLTRATLFFGAVALALAFLIAPVLDRGSLYLAARMGTGLDMRATGSIQRDRNQYVIQRSVLQAPGSPGCIVDAGSLVRSGC